MNWNFWTMQVFKEASGTIVRNQNAAMPCWLAELVRCVHDGATSFEEAIYDDWINWLEAREHKDYARIECSRST